MIEQMSLADDCGTALIGGDEQREHGAMQVGVRLAG
jgi:hypothetical protein